jgi:hypothetical protein
LNELRDKFNAISQIVSAILTEVNA